MTCEIYEREWEIVATSPSKWNKQECFCHLVSGNRKEMIYNFFLSISHEDIMALKLPVRELKEKEKEKEK